MSQKSITQQVCGICNGKEYASKIQIVSLEKILNFELLKLRNQYNMTIDDQSTNNVIRTTIHGGNFIVV